MKTQSQHTKGEWKIIPPSTKFDFYLISENDKHTCYTPNSLSEDKANAERIVKAVNMHEELIMFIGLCKDAFSHSKIKFEQDMYDKAKSILKQVEQNNCQ